MKKKLMICFIACCMMHGMQGTHDDTAGNTEKPEMYQIEDFPTKVLTGKNVPGLSYVLHRKTDITRLVLDASKKVDLVIKFINGLDEKLLKKGVKPDQLEVEKKKFVVGLRSMIQGPIEGFLEPLREDWCKQYFMDVLVEVFEGTPMSFDKTWLQSFLNAKGCSGTDFIQKTVVDNIVLNKLCVELKTVFDCLKITMPDAFAKAEASRKK